VVNRATVALLPCLFLSACQSAPAPASVEVSYRGRIAGAAIAALKDQGFACWLEHRRQVPGLDAPGPKDDHTRPVLFCSHWDPTPGLECVERRYTFEVDWVDAKAPDVMMVEQLRTRPIKGELYKCVPGSKDAAEKTEAPPALPVESIAAPAPLDGRTVADTLALMRADHFACALEYRQPSRGVIVSCSRWDPSPERACIEERVVFDIAWPDPSGDPLEQLGTAHVVGQAFRCSPNWNRSAAPVP
jgi:hypothetical protein